jgi:putative spermidine/putrescine transport system ATP-binding protein
MSHLEVRSLTVRFPSAQSDVLDGVDLNVKRGECLALLGPSGSGKTTLLRAIAGFQDLVTGGIRVAGQPIHHLAPDQRPVSLVFQRPRLFPHLNVLDNVALPLEAQGMRRRDARRDAVRFLELVAADGLSGRRPATLSGGQEQRVALARALAARPEVLLLDEPFSALDPQARDDMHVLLRELRAVVEPTLLLVTHDRNEAAAIADTAAVLLSGRIAQSGPLDDLMARPDSLHLHQFLGGANAIPGMFDGGLHHSALGALAVDPGSSMVTRGPALLLFRQEALALAQPYSTDPEAVTGTVVDHQRPGGAPRTVVKVAGVDLHVDRAYGQAVPEVGALVDVVIPQAARHVVADAPEAVASDLPQEARDQSAARSAQGPKAP